eukprot:4762354-Pleurochrysis_carterae.AAC.3
MPEGRALSSTRATSGRHGVAATAAADAPPSCRQGAGTARLSRYLTVHVTIHISASCHKLQPLIFRSRARNDLFVL